MVEVGEQFLIYADDFAQDDLSGLYAAGTSRSSGLMWPRVAGKRNGRSFWYAAALPPISRDRLPGGECALVNNLPVPPGPANPEGGFYPPSSTYFVTGVKDSYYRLPLRSGPGPGDGVATLTTRSPRAAMARTRRTRSTSAPGRTWVLAARGGRVVLMEDQDPYNSKDPDKPDDWTKFGNFIWLRHEDGTFATYFHNQKGSAKVDKGDVVRRGQTIAKVGQTGQASGPHVHFGAFHKTGLDFTDFTDVVGDVRIRIEARVGAAQDLDPCYIPRSGATFFSTNKLPLGD